MAFGWVKFSKEKHDILVAKSAVAVDSKSTYPSQNHSEKPSEESSEADLRTRSVQIEASDPKLVLLLNAWPNLPKSIRTTINTLMRLARSH